MSEQKLTLWGDLLLLQKIERNMTAMTNLAGIKMGKALARIIIVRYNCNTSADCQKLLKEKLNVN